MKTNKKEYIVVESPKGVFKIKVIEYKPIKTLGIIVRLEKKESYIQSYFEWFKNNDKLFDSKQDAVKHIDELVFHKEYRYEDLKAGLGIVVDGSDKEPEIVEFENGTRFEVKSSDGRRICDITREKGIDGFGENIYTIDKGLEQIKEHTWIDEVTEITEDMQKAMRGRHQRGFKLRGVPFEKLEDEGITIGEKIKAFRKELGLKQYELAEKLKITPAYLSDLENNKNTASIKTLKKLTEVFECYASDILMF